MTNLVHHSTIRKTSANSNARRKKQHVGQKSCSGASKQLAAVTASEPNDLESKVVRRPLQRISYLILLLLAIHQVIISPVLFRSRPALPLHSQLLVNQPIHRFREQILEASRIKQAMLPIQTWTIRLDHPLPLVLLILTLGPRTKPPRHHHHCRIPPQLHRQINNLVSHGRLNSTISSTGLHPMPPRHRQHCHRILMASTPHHHHRQANDVVSHGRTISTISSTRMPSGPLRDESMTTVRPLQYCRRAPTYHTNLSRKAKFSSLAAMGLT